MAENNNTHESLNNLKKAVEELQQISKEIVDMCKNNSCSTVSKNLTEEDDKCLQILKHWQLQRQ